MNLETRVRATYLSLGLALGTCFGVSFPAECKPELKKETKAQKAKYDSFVMPDDTVVQINYNVLNNAFFVYNGKTTELAMCLYGKELGRFLRIEETSIPPHSAVTEETASFDYSICKERDDFIGLMHNHPDGTQYPSGIDIERFYREQRAEVEMVVYKSEYDKKGRADLQYTIITKTDKAKEQMRGLMGDDQKDIINRN
jgi:proteasome lid subunit RPN8/RPN11